MTTTAKKFDLIDALIDAGFERGIDRTFTCDINGEYRDEVYAKRYETGRYDYFTVEVHVNFHNGNCYGVRVFYGNGKVKDHEYGKRAYNAIRDTLKYAGFEI